jgi:hypothetical protein
MALVEVVGGDISAIAFSVAGIGNAGRIERQASGRGGGTGQCSVWISFSICCVRWRDGGCEAK